MAKHKTNGRLDIRKARSPDNAFITPAEMRDIKRWEQISNSVVKRGDSDIRMSLILLRGSAQWGCNYDRKPQGRRSRKG